MTDELSRSKFNRQISRKVPKKAGSQRGDEVIHQIHQVSAICRRAVELILTTASISISDQERVKRGE